MGWERNGYAFPNADAAGLESALSRAIGPLYSYPGEFRERELMRADHSWARPTQDCLTIYEHIRHK